METKEIKRVFRYNGIELPDVPGHAPREVRDLYSAQYPELVSAEIEDGGVQNGEQVFTFRKAVGTKGAQPRLVALNEVVNAELRGVPANDGGFSGAMEKRGMEKRAQAWGAFARSAASPTSRPALCDMLAPVA